MKYHMLYMISLVSVMLHAQTDELAAVHSASNSSKKTIDVTKEAATELAKETKEAASALSKSAQQVFEKAQKSIAEIVVAESVSPSGEELYEKCKICHGEYGEKKASGKSAIIAGQPVNVLIDKLKAYRSEDRNTTGMGSVMNEQVKNMTEGQILAVAAYIETLKKQTQQKETND